MPARTQTGNPPPRDRPGTIRKVLCGVDFSPGSTQALRYAAELCQGLGAQLRVVHVYRAVVYAGSPAAGGLAHYRMALGEQLSELTANHVPAEVDCRQAVIEGVPYQRISEHAKELGVDLIVLGKKGHSTLPRILLGSVVERVMRLAHCPVLSVPAAARSGEG